MHSLHIQSYRDKKDLGDLGEAIVLDVVGGKLSEDKYDDEKDIIDREGRFVEVKTQNRHPTLDLFTIRANQALKCMNVERLVFVEFDESDTIRVWEVLDRQDTLSYRTNPTRTNRMGLQMIGWPASKMKLLHSFEDKETADQMKGMSGAFQFVTQKRIVRSAPPKAKVKAYDMTLTPAEMKVLFDHWERIYVQTGNDMAWKRREMFKTQKAA